MRSSNLLSKEWCDLIFENRNKDYGAYRIRQQTGARYRCALLVVFGAFLLLVLFYLGLQAYTNYLIERDMMKAEKALSEMIPSELKDGYKIRMVSTARVAPAVRMSAGASQSAPVIVDGTPKSKPLGIKGKFTFEPTDVAVPSPVVEDLLPKDSLLPVAKQKIIPTDINPQMPEFPGGARAFMRWLDENIIYPHQCVQNRKQGMVMVSFIVGIDGYPCDFKVEDAFDDIVKKMTLNALKRMPKWTPGVGEDGKPTPVMISVPVDFKL